MAAARKYGHGAARTLRRVVRNCHSGNQGFRGLDAAFSETSLHPRELAAGELEDPDIDVGRHEGANAFQSTVAFSGLALWGPQTEYCPLANPSRSNCFRFGDLRLKCFVDDLYEQAWLVLRNEFLPPVSFFIAANLGFPNAALF